MVSTEIDRNQRFEAPVRAALIYWASHFGSEKSRCG